MFKIITVLLCAISFNASATDEWTRADTYRETAYLIIHTIDLLQTSGVAKDGWEGRQELNPTLGVNPTVYELNRHYVITSVGHYVVSRLLPTEYRKAWQYISIGEAGNAVYANYRSGVRIQLKLSFR